MQPKHSTLIQACAIALVIALIALTHEKPAAEKVVLSPTEEAGAQ